MIDLQRIEDEIGEGWNYGNIRVLYTNEMCFLYKDGVITTEKVLPLDVAMKLFERMPTNVLMLVQNGKKVTSIDDLEVASMSPELAEFSKEVSDLGDPTLAKKEVKVKRDALLSVSTDEFTVRCRFICSETNDFLWLVSEFE